MMKRIIINILLVAGFGLLITAIVLPFAAERQYRQAKGLEESYRWRKAGEVYQQAGRLDPFNAEYSAGCGDFLMRQSQYHEDKSEWLERAEGLYERVCRLNPGHAEYRFLLGKVKLRLKDIDSGLEDFTTAIELDPYNFQINYYIGHNLISVWEFLDTGGRGFAADRLNYVLRSRPSHAEYVYPTIMYYTQDFSVTEKIPPETLIACEKLYYFIQENNFWQFRKQVQERLDFYRHREKPEQFEKERLANLRHLEEIKGIYRNKHKNSMKETDFVSKEEWKSGSTDGKDPVMNGQMYWNGTIYALINLKPGEATISLEAKKVLVVEAEDSQNPKFYPYMIVRLDDEEIGETFVGNDDWGNYPFSIRSDGGTKVLSVTFVNDIYEPERGEDRNLFIGNVKIDYK